MMSSITAGQCGVLRRLRRNDSVSVEPRLGEDPRRVAHVVEGDLRRLGASRGPKGRASRPPAPPSPHRLRRRWPIAAGGPADGRDGPGPSVPFAPTGRRRESREPGCGRPRPCRRTRGSSRRTRSRTPGRKEPPRASGPATRATKIGARLEEDLRRILRTEEPPPMIRRFRIHHPALGCHALALLFSPAAAGRIPAYCVKIPIYGRVR